MKKIKYFCLSLLSCVVLQTQASEVCHSQIAMLQCGAGTIDAINYLGMVDVNGTTVLGNFHVTGNVDAVDAHLTTVDIKGGAHITKSNISDAVSIQGNVHANETEIHGPFQLEGNIFATNLTLLSTANLVGIIYCESCLFKRDVTLVGNISATNSAFLGSLNLNAKKVQFIHSQLNDIHVKKSSDNEAEVLRFSNGSTVHNVSFESQKGIVVLESGAKLSGTLQGGKLETQSA